MNCRIAIRVIGLAVLLAMSLCLPASGQSGRYWKVLDMIEEGRDLRPVENGNNRISLRGPDGQWKNAEIELELIIFKVTLDSLDAFGDPVRKYVCCYELRSKDKSIEHRWHFWTTHLIEKLWLFTLPNGENYLVWRHLGSVRFAEVSEPTDQMERFSDFIAGRNLPSVNMSVYFPDFVEQAPLTTGKNDLRTEAQVISFEKIGEDVFRIGVVGRDPSTIYFFTSDKTKKSRWRLETKVR